MLSIWNFPLAYHFSPWKFPLLQLQRLVVSGELPCTQDEASTLAGIQLHLSDTWPDPDAEEEADAGNPPPPICDVQESDHLLRLDSAGSGMGGAGGSAGGSGNKRKEFTIHNR